MTERPETGGVWTRDPASGALSPVGADPDPATPTPPPEVSAPEPTPAARPKKGR